MTLNIYSELQNFKILIVNGKGNNGGDGWVMGRHLYNWGASVQFVLLGKAEDIKGDALVNYKIAKNMNLSITEVLDEKALQALSFSGYHALVDGIFGTGFFL